MTDLRLASDEWIAEHGRFLRRLARALPPDAAGAEDVAQEAWLAALEDPPRQNLAGWLVRVTRRLGRRSARTAGRRRAREEATTRCDGGDDR